eukprot:TCONS_00047922-protein
MSTESPIPVGVTESKTSPRDAQNMMNLETTDPGQILGSNGILPNSSLLASGLALRPGSITPSDSFMIDSQYYNDRIRSLESEKLTIMIEHNNLIKEFNKRMESHMEEIRSLKDSNIQYETELKDLQELSVFLDDDRKKCRKLAKEWQRFGRHTVAVMRAEMQGYQDKIKNLEIKQQKLVKENTELRDLCVYLDQQRSGAGIDGQSNGLNYSVCQECTQLKKEHGTIQRGKSLYNQNITAENFHDLQNQVAQLEREKDSLHKLLMFGGKSRRDKKRVSFSVPTDEEYDSSSTTSELSDRLDFPPSFGGSHENFNTISENSLSNVPSILRNGSFPLTMNGRGKLSDISPRNNDLARLHHNSLYQQNSLNEEEINEIREKLSRSTTGDATLSEREIAVLKDMCHVASTQSKLRSNSNASNASNSSLNASFDQSPLSPPPALNEVPLYKPAPPAVATKPAIPSKPAMTSSKEDLLTEDNPQPLNSVTESAESKKPQQTGPPPLPSYNEIMKDVEDRTPSTAKVEEKESESET